MGCKRPIKTFSLWWSTGKSCEFITIVNSILASQTANGNSSTSYVINPGFGRPIMRLVERAYLSQTPIGHCTSLELFLKNFFWASCIYANPSGVTTRATPLFLIVECQGHRPRNNARGRFMAPRDHRNSALPNVEPLCYCYSRERAGARPLLAW